MGELLLNKVLACRERIAKLRAALPTVPEDVLEDERLEAFLSFNLFLLIQDAIDLAAHLVSDRRLGVPGSHRESFELLRTAGLLSKETATAMGAMAALRNRIAHTYGSLDPVRMVREAPQGLSMVSGFLDELVQGDADY